jgi:cell division transport system permease protein
VRLRLIFSEAWRSLSANVSTTVAATVTVLIGMFLLGLFVALGTWVVSWSNHVKRELLVKVYFDDTAGVKQWNSAATFIQSDSRVKTVSFVSKEKALVIMRKKYPELTNDLAYNPLPNSIEVTPKRAEDTLAISQTIRTEHLAGVDKVKDGKNTASRILSVAKVIESVFLIAVVVLLAASTLLIANTIRLSIFSRRREIEVMKLVGATNWFVRGPFMVEGMICGLGGAVAAVILLIAGKAIVLPSIGIGHSKDAHAMAFELNALILIGIGLALGVAGTGLTLRRFLQI